MTKLKEAKRYIKRYYIRPQNVFASNKAEILQRLAEVEAAGANCSVYSLKALDDHDDVHLLQPKDIIYYYDKGVLYDKNHVPVLDYDLNVKNEEERPKISAKATSDERFKDVYQDRMTDRTVAEEFDNELTESPHYDPADYWDEDPDWMHVSRKTKSADWDIINKAKKQKYGQGYTTYGKASKANVSAGTYISIYGACDPAKAKEAFEKHLGEHKLDVRNFHAAYDNILEDEGVLGVFNKDGIMHGKGVYGQIKECKNYRVKAILTKFWVAQFKDNCEIYYGTFGESLTEELDSYETEILKKAVDNGEEINLGWDSDNPEVSGFSDHGYYSDTEYILWQNSAKKYIISEWHYSNDGDLLEGDDYEFNSFSEVIDWINHKNFSTSGFDIPAEYWEENDEFSQDFDDIDAYGRNLTEDTHNTFICCICGEESEGYGNNPDPVRETGKCCDACNRKFVIPARLNIEVED